MGEKQLKVINAIKENNAVTISELTKIVGISSVTIEKYLPHYAKTTKAVFLEDDIFTTTILISESKEGVEKGVEEIRKKLGNSAVSVLELIAKYPQHSASSIADILDLNKRTVQKIFAKLRNANVIERIGPDKGGHWKILIDI